MSLQPFVGQLKPRINLYNKKQFTEAYNVPIQKDSNIDDFDTKLDKSQLKSLLKHLLSLKLDDIPIAGGSAGIKVRSAQDKDTEIRAWAKENAPDIKISFGQGSIGKGGGVKISESTQELMVAALVLNKVKSGNIDEVTAIEMIEEAKTKFNNIEGASGRPDLIDQFTGNFNDLATAISSSNAILKVVSNPVKAYWTGKGWGPDIKKYNPPVGGVKDYNSSDIVVKSGDGVFYGFSLKKKAKSKDVDPTLINKPITGNVGILKDILGAREIASIEKSKELFFDYVVYKHTKKSVKGMDVKEKNKIISTISQRQMGVYLKDRKNTFFRRVDQVLSKNAESFIKSFIELLFRTKMKDIEDSGEFKFYLLTGIGRFIGGTLEVEEAENKDVPQTIEALTNIFNSKLTMTKTPGKLNAWEKGSNTAGAPSHLTVMLTELRLAPASMSLRERRKLSAARPPSTP